MWNKLEKIALWMLLAAIWYMIPYPDRTDWIVASRVLFYGGSVFYLISWIFVKP